MAREFAGRNFEIRQYVLAQDFARVRWRSIGALVDDLVWGGCGHLLGDVSVSDRREVERPRCRYQITMRAKRFRGHLVAVSGHRCEWQINRLGQTPFRAVTCAVAIGE